MKMFQKIAELIDDPLCLVCVLIDEVYLQNSVNIRFTTSQSFVTHSLCQTDSGPLLFLMSKPGGEFDCSKEGGDGGNRAVRCDSRCQRASHANRPNKKVRVLQLMSLCPLSRCCSRSELLVSLLDAGPLPH